jgi:helicase
MDIEFLKHYDFPEPYVTTLQNNYGNKFLPLQEKGIKQGKLFEGSHLLVQAPTSSGKTMLAELLFLHHVRIPRSTLLLVPSKALANQRYHDLKKRYTRLGFKICLSTRDHPYHDSAIRKGDFHLAVLVYEKLLSLLTGTPTLLSYTGACVMDEMHYVLDPKRGCEIDLLLTRIKQETHIQRMGLSAIEMDDEICDWLELQRLELQQRPVELRQGVLCQGKFHYREFNTNQKGIEELPLDESVDDGAAMLEAAEHFYQKDESTLLFFPTRELCYTAARKFADSIQPETTLDSDTLSHLEDSNVKQFLSTLIPKRISIHTSDLTMQERETVETLIQQQKIRVIFATSTLAEGINFPVTNVITTKHMYAKPVSAISNLSQPIQMPVSYDRQGWKAGISRAWQRHDCELLSR